MFDLHWITPVAELKLSIEILVLKDDQLCEKSCLQAQTKVRFLEIFLAN